MKPILGSLEQITGTPQLRMKYEQKEKIRIISLTSKITSILDIGVATIKSNDTARIREAHKFIGYIVCELIEKKYL